MEIGQDFFDVQSTTDQWDEKYCVSQKAYLLVKSDEYDIKIGQDFLDTR